MVGGCLVVEELQRGRRLSTGGISIGAKLSILLLELQWGHRLSARETCLSRNPVSPPLPSLQWSHRPLAMETTIRCRNSISATRLQWSHRLSAMETRLSDSVIWRALMLQWGHRLSAMETGALCPVRRPGRRPSMEPPPFGDGNRTFGPQFGNDLYELQ